MSRRAQPEENHERWLVSYADFITLLFAFFVVMFALAEVDRKKLASVAESYSAYLEGGREAVQAVAAARPAPLEDGERTAADLTAQEMAEIEREVRDVLDELVRDESVRVTLEARGLVISLQEATLFGAGEASFRQGSEEMLEMIGSALGAAPGRQIRLEGHTDNRPIHTAKFPSNWELSSARATVVMRALADRFGLAEARVSVSGYGEHRPAASNETPEGRAQNRRVDVVILSRGAAADEPRLSE